MTDDGSGGVSREEEQSIGINIQLHAYIAGSHIPVCELFENSHLVRIVLKQKEKISYGYRYTIDKKAGTGTM
jgi:hypothetical protein